MALRVTHNYWAQTDLNIFLIKGVYTMTAF